jgi:hypothetical protein
MSERRVFFAVVTLAVLALPSAASAASDGAAGPSPVPLIAEIAFAALIVLVKLAHTWITRRVAARPRSADRAAAAARPRAVRAR